MYSRFLVFFAIMIALSSNVFADTVSFNSYLYTGGTMTVDNQVIAIYLSGTENGVIADFSGSLISVLNNSCETKEYVKLCLDNIILDTSTRRKKIYMRAISTIPVLAISKSASKSDLQVGEETIFTVTITNTGGIARNATYTEPLPPYLEVTDTDGVSVKGNNIEWKGYVERLGTRDFTYTLKAKDDFKQVFKSSVRFFDGYLMKTVYSPEVTITAKHPLKFDVELGKTSLFMGQPTNMSINITNQGNETLNFSIEVFFGEGIEVLPANSFSSSIYNANEFTFKNDSYNWNGNVRKKNMSWNNKVNVSVVRDYSKEFFFEFKPARIGELELLVKPSFYSKGRVVNLPEVRKNLKVEDRGVEMRANLDDQIIESNQQKKVKFWIQNMNAYTPIYDIKVSTFSDFGYISDFEIPVLLPSEQRLLVDSDYYAPNISSSTGYRLEANATYALSGQRKEKIFKDTISILPIKDLVITQTLSKSQVESAEDFFMTVKVDNPRTTGLNKVLVEDSTPKDFSISGTKKTLVSIAKVDSAFAYTYRLTAPRVSNKTVFKLKTDVSYNDFDNELSYGHYYDYNFSKETDVTVIPSKLSLSIDRRLRDSEVYRGRVYDIDYELKNPNEDDQGAFGIIVHFPLSQEYDLVENLSINVSDPISTGESIYLKAVERFRLKTNLSFSFPKSFATYSNQYGDNFSENSTDISPTIKSGAIDGAAIVLVKNITESVNNIDPFNVSLSISNIGKQPALVDITDGDVSFSISVPEGKEIAKTYLSRVKVVGTAELSQAVASYTTKGLRMHTGSNRPKVIVSSRQLIDVEKSAPAKTSNVQSFQVKVRVINKASVPIDVQVVDGANSWNLSGLVGEKTFTYDERIEPVGKTILESATASYLYDGESYSSVSGQPSINVEEKKLLTVKKSSSKLKVKPGEETTIRVSLINEQEKPLTVTLSDNGQEWKLYLVEGKEEVISYKLKVSQTNLDPASASFVFDGEVFSASSNKLVLEFEGSEKVQQPSKEDGKPVEESGFKKIINSFNSLFSFLKPQI